MKVAILGYSGAGKSTLSRKISEKYNIPVLHLDKINFNEGWQKKEVNEVQKIVEEFLNNNKSWIIDGNYSKIYFERRMEEADKIIFLNFPRRVCFFRAYKRYKDNKNRVREDAAKGCIEKFDFEFIKWILIDGRTKKYKDRYKKVCKEYEEKIIICKNEKEVNNLLDNINIENN